MFYLEVRTCRGIVRWELSGKDRFVVGRSNECDFRLTDPSISRTHACLTLQGDQAAVEDLGSRNGVWLNGSRVHNARLRPGEWFHLGTVPMALRQGISIGVSLFSTDSGRQVAPPSPEDPTTLDVAPNGQADLEWIEPLAEFFDGQRSTDALLAEVLARACRHLHQEAIAAVRDRQREPPLVLGTWGPAIALDGLLTEGHRLELGRDDGIRLALPARPTTRLDGALARLLGALAARVAAQSVEASAEHQPAGTSPPRTPSEKQATFIAVSELSNALLDEVDCLAASRLPVLLIGESGTGKEVLARRLHLSSPRADGPFVAINCSALPKELLEAELFGIEKGVATGVDGRQGWFVRAHGGTLFLDEIGDMPASLQPKLLRVLETREVVPVGARRSISTDVRIVAASHRPLGELAREGEFRHDLLYRLSGAVVRIPALRERPSDIFPLVLHVARRVARELGRAFRGIDVEAARILLGYAWPGNVRELNHIVERAIALSDGAILHAGLLPEEMREVSDRPTGDLLLAMRGDWRTAREHFDRIYFTQLITRCEGRMTKVAHIAGLARSNLYRRLKELGLR